MCFVWIWEQTAIISVYRINWLVFITETECLLRSWILTSHYVSSNFLGRAMFQAAFYRASPGSIPGLCMLLVHKVALWQASLPVLRLSPVSTIPPIPHTHLHRHGALTRRTGETWEPAKKHCSFENRGAVGWKEPSIIFLFITCEMRPAILNRMTAKQSLRI